ncbi:hypothetical protein BDBG_03790 [Blastomyces gilchristii SLH14081]|uniref:Aminoglycoside phosphotransferase domain-containing protein n=1 Tax=Blastomyces gilchristii (strain SLH14081) TaxID=559298 RepID=A0A179UIB4_BLAGS|nr:uncharacterized protein BDBG_03790 [Blastomyces gilchristii SLH14081]OAT07755.1 hypothetical protein BDBG_03790 [Blastomyces gilchristii SLH14081]
MEPDPFTPKDGYGQVIYAFFPDMPKIIRLDEHRILKSAITNSTETEAMKFVAANTTIPVPKDGLMLLKLSWNTSPANPLAKSGENSHTISRCSSVISSAASSPNVQKLRPTTTPALIESANGGPVTVGLRFPRRGGPFDSEKEFNDFLVGSGMKDNHEIHFAHGDFSPRNIMVDVDSGEVKAVLDWDRAGWYPEYWIVVGYSLKTLGYGIISLISNALFPSTMPRRFLQWGYSLRFTGVRQAYVFRIFRDFLKQITWNEYRRSITSEVTASSTANSDQTAKLN